MKGEKYKVGLVLSGGGARGYAHLGVLHALLEKGITPDIVSGTSAGAITGSLFCDGYSPLEILSIMDSKSRLSYMRPTLPRDGLLDIAGMARILEANLRAKTFEELKIPLITSATDLNHGKAVYFSSGELIRAVIASASIPVLFKPVVIDDVLYVDGGVLDNLPVKPLIGKCDLLIGSFVNPAGQEDKISGLVNIAVRTFLLSMAKEVEQKSKLFDIFVAPMELKDYGILDPEKAVEMYNIGYKAMKNKLENAEIASLISERLSS